MLTMEWKIGEIKQINGEWYQCMKELGCDNCDLIGTKYCDHDKCSHLCRKDKTSVIFKKLEKIGEPYTHYCPSGRIIYFQRYKLFYKLYSHNTEYIMCDFNEDGIVSIEIKQNKEDMDENKLNLKPFDIQKAREGKPVCTRDRKKARIICFDKGGIYPVIALVQEEGSETCHFYEKDGKCADSGNGHDLLMLSEKKEGWANVYDDTPIYDTKEEALNRRSKIRGYIDTVKVSWEE